MKKTIAAPLLAFAVAGSLFATAGAASARTHPAPGSRAAVLNCPPEMSCGSYTVAGLGTRKQQVLAAGASVLDLSVAMEETASMQASAYPYRNTPSRGDRHADSPYAFRPNGDNKTGDAINFGIFKQNWVMLRTACAQFRGQSAASYNNGAVLNSNLRQDVTCMNQDQSYYGQSQWFAGERGGATGLRNPNTTDINNYRTAIAWIQGRLLTSPQDQRNDTRLWVYVVSLRSVAASIVGDRARNGTVVERVTPAGTVTVNPDGTASLPVEITFSDGTQVAGVAFRYVNGASAYTLSRR